MHTYPSMPTRKHTPIGSVQSWSRPTGRSPETALFNKLLILEAGGRSALFSNNDNVCSIIDCSPHRHTLLFFLFLIRPFQRCLQGHHTQAGDTLHNFLVSCYQWFQVRERLRQSTLAAVSRQGQLAQISVSLRSEDWSLHVWQRNPTNFSHSQTNMFTFYEEDMDTLV